VQPTAGGKSIEVVGLVSSHKENLSSRQVVASTNEGRKCKQNCRTQTDWLLRGQTMDGTKEARRGEEAREEKLVATHREESS
jgi:hypothetical protein